MVSLNVDCCSVTAQDNEPRVTFTTQKFLPVAEETPVVCIIREHIPLSAVFQFVECPVRPPVVTDKRIPITLDHGRIHPTVKF